VSRGGEDDVKDSRKVRIGRVNGCCTNNNLWIHKTECRGDEVEDSRKNIPDETGGTVRRSQQMRQTAVRESRLTDQASIG
jgi:hypothetical protein